MDVGDGDGSLANSKKFNSTATLFVDSTVSQPSLDDTLRWLEDGVKGGGVLFFLS